ncbi:EAL domain-containing protein [Pseudoalteromonas sp. SSDWG2]|uniref:EAL domain-containing protein n=1 Tax=Pseudoalteromonas sp. SSDWG2 TaxID=3139391 RepID=UPI003BAAEDC8
MANFRKYKKLLLTCACGIALAVIVNVMMAVALVQQRQAQLHTIGHQVEQLGSMDERLIIGVLAPYGYSLEPQQNSFIVPTKQQIYTHSTAIDIYSSPVWLSKSYWFIAINSLLIAFFWRSFTVARRQLKEVKRKQLAREKRSVVNDDMFGVSLPYQSIFAIVYCQRLCGVAKGVVNLFEALLQEHLEHQHRLSARALNSGCLAITVHEIQLEELDAQLEKLEHVVMSCCRSLLPEIKHGEVKIGVCNYRNGADQAVVYQLTCSALALAKQSRDKHCYRIAFSYNHSLLLAAKSCSLIDAIERQQFVCFFQPVFDLHNDDILHHETLLRVRHPQLGLISPEYLLHSSHQEPEVDVKNIDLAVLKRLDNLLSADELQAGVTLNIHPNVWRDDDFWDELCEFLLTHPRVVLECPASLVAKQPHLVAKRLASSAACKRRGVIIDQLTKWPADALKKVPVMIRAIKLSSEMIAHIDTDKQLQRRVLTYVANAHAIGVPVYAVGVERHAQLQVLKQLGVRGAQGYYFTGAINQISVFNTH